MNNNYWINFWKDYTNDLSEKDKQSQVLRTFNKKPITDELWSFTLDKIDEVFKVIEGDNVLDLCSGNGLISKHLLYKGANVVAVDISDELLKNVSNTPGIKTINSDIRLLEFDDKSFNRVILYAGIQYLNDKEAILLLQKIFRWLKPGGTLFIGDIPDFNKRWDFFNTKKRQEVFYENQLAEKAIVGNWFEIKWFDHLTNYIGFKEGLYLEQDEKLIYSSFRFDYLYLKRK